VKAPSVVVLGGGLSGAATAYTLGRAGWRDVTIVERGSALGGLAGSFETGGRFYPLGYHHILHRDQTLLFFLDLIGALSRVRWRRIRMLFEAGGGLYDLGRSGDFLRFPMALSDKLRFIFLMLRAMGKQTWSDWELRSAAELIDSWAGPGVRRVLFEPLMRLKFQLPCEAVSAAWLGARLSFREGVARLGYIPDANWTRVLCDGMTRLLDEVGVRVRLGVAVERIFTRADRIVGLELSGGERIAGDLFVSTIPTEVLQELLPNEGTPFLGAIRYTALISAVCAARQKLGRDFYWLNLTSLGHTACGLFVLSALNPTIGEPGDTCVNFVTHLRSRTDPLFREPEEGLMARYRLDFRKLFGFELEPFWTHVTRIPLYSPIFVRDYRNPPVRSTTWANLSFAGNYRTFPSVASTGTAMASGLECGQSLLHDHGLESALAPALRAFHVRSWPPA
jgi:protoporphyrinogen oxidase